MTRLTLPCLLAIFFILAPDVAAQTGDRPAADPLEGLDAYIEQALEDWQVPGVAVAIIKDGELVLARGYGVRDLESREPVDEHTIFAIASVTKAFTSAAMAMLVDEGLVDWDDRVMDHLPDFRLYDTYATREMRVRDLFIHNSGLPGGFGIWWGTPYTRQEIMDRLRYLEPVSSFRSRFGYSNLMYLVAGQLLEAVTGESWDDFTTRRIFEPLGMRRSSTSVHGLEARTNVATPYERIDGPTRPVPWRNIDNAGTRQPDNTGPAGSINSSVHEMAEWLRLHLDGGTYGGEELLSRQVLREMHSPHIVVPRGPAMEALLPETNLVTYGLGWSIMDYHGRKLLAHSGGTNGMRAQIGLVPQEGLGFVILSNMNAGRPLPQAISHRVLDAYLAPDEDRDWRTLLRESEEGWLRSAREQLATLEDARIEGTSPGRSIDEYAGTYRDDFYGDVVVRNESSGLVLEYAGGHRAELEHWHHETFRAHWGDVMRSLISTTFGWQRFVTFHLGHDGKVKALEWVGPDRPVEFERVEADDAANPDE